MVCLWLPLRKSPVSKSPVHAVWETQRFILEPMEHSVPARAGIQLLWHELNCAMGTEEFRTNHCPNPGTFTYLIVLLVWLVWWRGFVVQGEEFCVLWLFFGKFGCFFGSFVVQACCLLGLSAQQLPAAAIGFPRSFCFERVNFWKVWSLSITIYGCFRQHKVVFQDFHSGYSLCPCWVWEPRAPYSSLFFFKGCLSWCSVISRVWCWFQPLEHFWFCRKDGQSWSSSVPDVLAVVWITDPDCWCVELQLPIPVFSKPWYLRFSLDFFPINYILPSSLVCGVHLSMHTICVLLSLGWVQDFLKVCSGGAWKHFGLTSHPLQVVWRGCWVKGVAWE